MNGFRLYVYNSLAVLLPATRMFGLKRRLLRWAGARVGSNVRIVSSARFLLSGPLEIGANTWIGHDVLIVGGGAAVRIGAKVDIAPRVTIVTGSHEVFTIPEKAAGRGFSAPITIGDGVWVGASATILGGVSLGPRSIVAAGALVRSDVAAKAMVAGVPAIPVKSKNGDA